MNDVDFVGRLHRALDVAPPYALPAVTSAVLAEAVGAKDVGLMLADYGEVTLERVSSDVSSEDHDSVPIDGSTAGEAFLSQTLTEAADDSGQRLYIPAEVR